MDRFTMLEDDPLPWTTTRCNRLLRPLQARITALKKALYGRTPDEESGSSKIAASALPIGASREESPPGEDTETSWKSIHDPDWVPTATARRNVKRQYSGRPAKGNAQLTRREAGKATRPGEISIPTPLIARHAQMSFGSPWRSPQVRDGNPFREMPKQWKNPLVRQLALTAINPRKEMTPDLWRQVDQLLTSFTNLLQSTSKPATREHSGARSLMSTCLRQIPAYIQLEQYWQDQDSPDKLDVGPGIYEDLESMGTGEGWRPLREVVRAHGVALLTEAIAERILPVETVAVLVRVCVRQQAFQEAEQFLSAWLHTSGSIPRPTGVRAELFHYERPTYPAISAAYAFAEQWYTWAFFYRHVESMITAARLPIEWLATQSFMPVWSRIIRSVSQTQDPAHSAAVDLLHTVLQIACDKDSVDMETQRAAKDGDETSVAPVLKEAMSNTISSLSTILASIVLVSNNATAADATDPASLDAQAVQWALECAAGDLAAELLSGQLDMKSNAVNPRLTSILTYTLLLRITGRQLGQHISNLDVTKLIEALELVGKGSSRSLAVLPSLVSSLAKCCGKAFRNDGFEFLKLIVETLISPRPSPQTPALGEVEGLESSAEGLEITFNASPISLHAQWFLKRLALDSAFEFAEQSKLSAHLAFARNIEEIMETNPSFQSAPTPFKCTSVSRHASPEPDQPAGYRWEAGISEWVAITPHALREKKQKKPVFPSQSHLPPPPSPSPVLSTPAHLDGALDATPCFTGREEDILDLQSSPIKATDMTPIRPRPTLSQILLANATPDVLAWNSPLAAPLKDATSSAGTGSGAAAAQPRSPPQKRQRRVPPRSRSLSGPRSALLRSSRGSSGSSDSAFREHDDADTTEESDDGEDEDSRTEVSDLAVGDDDDDDDDGKEEEGDEEEDELSFSQDSLSEAAAAPTGGRAAGTSSRSRRVVPSSVASMVARANGGARRKQLIGRRGSGESGMSRRRSSARSGRGKRALGASVRLNGADSEDELSFV